MHFGSGSSRSMMLFLLPLQKKQTHNCTALYGADRKEQNSKSGSCRRVQSANSRRGCARCPGGENCTDNNAPNAVPNKCEKKKDERPRQSGVSPSPPSSFPLFLKSFGLVRARSVPLTHPLTYLSDQPYACANLHLNVVCKGVEVAIF